MTLPPDWCFFSGALRLFRAKVSLTAAAPDATLRLVLPLLQWTPGATAVFHNVYLGTGPQLGESCDPAGVPCCDAPAVICGGSIEFPTCILAM